eukprot:SAG31_NODE_9977_length_1202_cov_1.017226_2_plen_162_part_01
MSDDDDGDEDEDVFTGAQSPMQSGQLVVTVVGGMNLKAKKVFGRASPFCVISIGHEEQQFQVHACQSCSQKRYFASITLPALSYTCAQTKEKEGTSPMWQETFHFDVDSDTAPVLDIDIRTKSGSIGIAAIGIADVCSASVDSTAHEDRHVALRNRCDGSPA